MKKVLILCTGNSCRSQMAEVMMNQMGQGQYEAVSAGAKPSGYVHPLAIQTLKKLHYPVNGLRSKSWDEFKGRAFDAVITVCDRAKESCPIWPGNPEVLHWSFEDPAEAKGTDDQKSAVFQKIANEIQQRIRLYLSSEAAKNR